MQTFKAELVLVNHRVKDDLLSLIAGLTLIQNKVEVENYLIASLCH